MMLNDLRELLLNGPSFFKGKSSYNLIKNNFPLIVQIDDISDFSVNNEYNLAKIKNSKIFRQSAFYKKEDSQDFEEFELILYNKYIFFAQIIKNDLIKIVLKFKLKSIGLYSKKNEDDSNIINIYVNIKENDEEDLVNLKYNNTEEGKDEENLNIIVKFNDEKIKDEVSKKINEKILTINNEERLAFDGYFKKINNTFKDIGEDF